MNGAVPAEIGVAAASSNDRVGEVVAADDPRWVASGMTVLSGAISDSAMSPSYVCVMLTVTVTSRVVEERHVDRGRRARRVVVRDRHSRTRIGVGRVGVLAGREGVVRRRCCPWPRCPRRRPSHRVVVARAREHAGHRGTGGGASASDMPSQGRGGRRPGRFCPIGPRDTWPSEQVSIQRLDDQVARRRRRPGPLGNAPAALAAEAAGRPSVKRGRNPDSPGRGGRLLHRLAGERILTIVAVVLLRTTAASRAGSGARCRGCARRWLLLFPVASSV